MSGTAKSASDEYGLSEPIHFRKRIKTLRLAIHLAKGVAIFKKTASTMKYIVAKTKTADFKRRFTWNPEAGIHRAVDRANRNELFELNERRRKVDSAAARINPMSIMFRLGKRTFKKTPVFTPPLRVKISR